MLDPGRTLARTRSGLYSSFSPAQTLAQTASLAAANNLFGQARDALWKQASGESVFDGAQTLIAENRVLQSSAIQSLMTLVGADGTLTTTVGQLEALINAGVAQISNQNCALAPGTTGASPSDCASGALRDAQHVAQQCPTGATSAAGCQAARNQGAAAGRGGRGAGGRAGRRRGEPVP